MILAYSIASDAAIRIPEHIKSISLPGLRCFYQFVERPPKKADLHADAVRLFETNRRIFAQADILEFRFPTVLQDEPELLAFLEKNEAQLAAELRRLAGTVQINVLVLADSGDQPVATGTEYLRARRDKMLAYEALVRKIREAAGQNVLEIVERPAQLLLRVPRAGASRVIQDVSDIPRTRVAGPFPPSAFAKLLS